MAAGGFDGCEQITLKWEGGYSNDADDPGGATQWGITQANYDTSRKKWGMKVRSVKLLTTAEANRIYKEDYWQAAGCEDLPQGMDLCVFDAAVNSGVTRAKAWFATSPNIDAYCDARLAFLHNTVSSTTHRKMWPIFGKGWGARVSGIRAFAKIMAGQTAPEAVADGSLHAGMKGDAVTALQTKLRALGYPCGNVDGVYGEQSYRAVILFQTDHQLQGDPGVWLPSYDAVLADAAPMLPARQTATVQTLVAAGDKQIIKMNFMQRMFGYVFGGAAVAQAFQGQSVMDSVSGFQNIISPVQGVVEWASSNRFILVAVGAVALIALIRFLRADHVTAYQNFDYQGQAKG